MQEIVRAREDRRCTLRLLRGLGERAWLGLQ